MGQQQGRRPPYVAPPQGLDAEGRSPEAILSAYPEVVLWVLDRESRYRYVSPQGAILFQLEPAAMVGRSWRELGLPGDFMAPFEACLHRVFHENIAVTGAMAVPVRGERRHFEYTLAPLETAEARVGLVIASAAWNVTERVRIQESLHRGDQLLRGLMRSAPDANRREDNALYHEEKVNAPVKDSSGALTHAMPTGQNISDRMEDEAIRKRLTATLEATTDFVAVADLQGHLLYANAAWRGVLGLGPDDEFGTCTIFDGYTGRACAKLKNKAIPAAIREGTWSGELVLIGQDGLEIPVSELIIAHRGPEGEVEFLSAIARDISERKRLEEKLAYWATHDALTHIPNRMLLLDRLQQSIAYARRHRHGVGVLFVDLDRFKRINDTLGHHVGDFILGTVAKRIRHHLRRSDTVGRQGGDEFVVIAAEVSDRDDLAPLVNKIRKAVSEPIKVKDHQIVLTCSIGIAVYPFDGESPELLLENADTAMYQAKGDEHGDCRYYAKEMNAQCHEVLKLEEELRRAVSAGEFVLYYQPQVDLQTGRFSRMEALIRWLHPEHGLLAPGAFIPVLEETGLIEPVGEWVLQEAARQAGAWKEMGLPPVVVAVNLSAKQLASPCFAETVERIVTATGTSPTCLELEITESVLMEGASDGVAALRSLSQHGMRIAVDDFGTGYCALHYMRRLPVDTLKVDQGFVRNLEEDSITASIVSSIITLGHNLGCLVVAEGVETDTQRDILRQLGCDIAQGYLYCHPSPPEEIEHLLQRGA